MLRATRQWRPKYVAANSTTTAAAIPYHPSLEGGGCGTTQKPEECQQQAFLRPLWLSTGSRRGLKTARSATSSYSETKVTMKTRRNQLEQEGLAIPPPNEIPAALSSWIQPPNNDGDVRQEEEMIKSSSSSSSSSVRNNVRRRGERGGDRRRKYYNREEAEKELKISQDYFQAMKTRHEELVRSIPVGGFKKEDWSDGRDLMMYYCQLGRNKILRQQHYQQYQQQSQQPAIPNNELPHGIGMSLELLDRLLQEIQQQQQQQQQQQASVVSLEQEETRSFDSENHGKVSSSSSSSLFRLESDWLQMITMTWRVAYQKLATHQRRGYSSSSNNNNSVVLMEPMELFHKIFDLSDRSDGLLTINSPKIYLALMDVSLRRIVKQHEQHLKFQKKDYPHRNNSGGSGDFTPTTRKMRETAEFMEWMFHLGIERTRQAPNTPSLLGTDPKAYQIVLNAWEWCCDGPRAHRILQTVCELYDHHHHHQQQQQQHSFLQREAFESVLKAYAKGPKTPNTVSECRQILERMKYYHTQHGLDTMPKTLAYNTLLTCLLHSPSSTPTKTNSIVEEGERLFYEEIPKQYRDRTTYNILLELYSKYARDEKAARLLNELVEESTAAAATNNKDYEVEPPDTKTFNLLLQASHKAENFDAVEKTIRMMEELQSKNILNNVAPDKFSYSILLDSWSKQVGKVPGACDRVDAIFHTMKRLALEKNDKSLKPTTITYTTLMNAFAKAGNARRTQELLGEMMDRYMVGGDKTVRPDRTTFNTVLLALSRSDQHDAISKIETLMQQMEEMSINGTLGQQDLQPDVRSFNSLLQAKARSGQRDAGEQCERIMLERMCPNPRLQPNSFTYVIIVQAYAKAGKAEQAERILEQVCDEYYNNKNRQHNQRNANTNKPTVQIYSAVMNAWSKRKTKDSPERAEALFRRMKELSEAGDLAGRIDRMVYNTLLDTWANSGREEAGERCEEILQQMESSGGIITPNTITYNVAMKAWSVLGNPDRCQNLFHRMRDLPGIQPGHETLCTLLTAFSRSDFESSEERAEVLLKKLHELQIMSGITANVACYNVVLDSLSKSDKAESALVAEDLFYEMERLSEQASQGKDGRSAAAVLPDAVSYACVMDAFANKGDAEKTEMFLERLIQEYVRTNDSRLRPTVSAFNIALKAYAQKCKKAPSPEAPERAEALIDRMQRLHQTAGVPVKPDVTSMNILMDVWGHSTSRRSNDRVLAILQSMVQSKDADITPTTISYNTALNALAISGECARAENLLKSMHAAYNEKAALHDHMLAKPNLISWNSLLTAYAKSKLPAADTAQRAEKAIEKMDELFAIGTLDARPNTHSFNCLLHCLALSSRSDAGVRCETILEEMQSRFESGDENAKPTAPSMGAGIKAWLNCGNLEAAQTLLDRMCVAYEMGDESMKPNMKTLQGLLLKVTENSTDDSSAAAKIKERARHFYPHLLEGTTEPVLSHEGGGVSSTFSQETTG